MNNYLGSGPYGEITFLDLVAILSFMVGMKNLEENMTQSDKQELEEQFNQRLDKMLIGIHTHLEAQDDKIDEILQLLKTQNFPG